MRKTFVDLNPNRRRRTFFDLSDKPVLLADFNYAGYVSTLDPETGYVTRTEFFGTDDQPARHRRMFSSVTRRIEDGRIRAETQEGYDGERGFTRFQIAYDASGHAIKHAFLNDEDQLVLNRQTGVAGWDSELDPQGNEIRQVYFGLNGKPPQRGKSGEAGFDAEYADGKIVTATYFGYGDERGFKKFKLYFDANGRVVRRIRSRGHLVLDPQQDIAGWRTEYDDAGHPTKNENFGVDDKPRRHKDGTLGTMFAYDENGTLIDKRIYGLDPSRGFTIIRSHFDSDGREIRRDILTTINDWRSTHEITSPAGPKRTPTATKPNGSSLESTNNRGVTPKG